MRKDHGTKMPKGMTMDKEIEDDMAKKKKKGNRKGC